LTRGGVKEGGNIVYFPHPDEKEGEGVGGNGPLKKKEAQAEVLNL